MPFQRLLVPLVVAVAAGSAAAVAAPTARGASPGGSATVTLTILQARHGADSMVPGPNFAIAPGVSVTLKVVNFTSEWHMFTVPGLGVSTLIKPRQGATPRVTWVRFTAQKFGVFGWYCVLCRDGLHRHAHDMGGKVYAIIGEPSP